ncbi:hypothetical protein N7474_000257 [Penicillium riverlandense]|uniref:uncharacterized protein n=1 Tax=Penicillium riverlandense TaxID=1903569 RepID=UPI00254766B6|nr:uncharacterized protein N7474_000257 [Penicillium riverlandense]KAJ5831946.1 hypothetical protein N7474_000257 [Penicillium riverlandense]
MPRARVRPENRLRSSRACDLCKASKIRCDSQVPCASCIKRNHPGNCIYSIPPSRRARPGAGDRSSGPTPSRLRPFAHGVWTDSPTVSNSAESYTSNPPLIVQPSPKSINAGSGDWTKDPDQDSPSERFVTGSNGEKLYIGDTASLSFLDFLRRNLRPYVGATPFTDGERQNLELEIDVDDATNVEVNLTVEEKGDALLYLFSPAEIDAFMGRNSEHPSTELKKDDIAALEMTVAIGAQARASGSRDAQCAAVYFARARSIAFQDMLAYPSISMVRIFLLLAFFTLGACRQNAAFIYLGVASKAAIVLGLHQPMSWQSLQQQADGPNLRYLTFTPIIPAGLCILDVLTSSILGRPCTVPRATRHDLHSLPLDPNTPEFNAVLKGAALLDDICRILSSGVMIDVPTAEDLLTKLRQWSQNLPPCLRQFSCTDGSSMSSVDRQTFLGRIHVSSVYYFSVMLVTRPFLIRHLMSKLRRRSGHEVSVNLHPNEAGLAQVCTSSAAYMGELCRKTALAVTMSELPFGNLCLFKTWAFGAGLILGLSLFVAESSSKFQEPFTGILDVLNKIGEASPQSKLYGETLSTFMDTIHVYRRQLSHHPHRTVDQYIDQILVIDVEPHQSGRQSMPSNQHFMNSPWDTDAGFTMALDSGDLTLVGQSGLDDYWSTQQPWDDVAMQFSDNFGIDFGAQFLQP